MDRCNRALMRARHLSWLGLAVLCSPAVMAQDAGGAVVSRSLAIEPSISLQQTFTDNIDLVASGQKAESITQISPGIRMSSRSGRMQASLSYALNALIHARDSDRNTLQNALDAVLNAELIERHAFIDARASISQQTISAFGTQAGGTGLVNDNRTEVSTFSVSPSLRGRLGDAADVVAKVSWLTTRAASTDLGDGSSVNGSLGLSGTQGLFGWGLDTGWQSSDFKDVNNSTRDQTFATLSFAPDPELRLSLRGGIEGENVVTGSRETTDFWGYGISWQPSERTTAALQSDQRFFGRSHSVNLQHRMAQSIWSYTDSRGVSDTRNGLGDPLNATQSRAVTNLDLFLARFPSIELGDSARRKELVRALLSNLGIDPDAQVGGGFLSSGVTEQRSQNLSVALIGSRTTFTLAGFRSETEPLDTTASSSGDFANVGRVRQAGFSAGVSHRLTPISTLALTTSLTKTRDEGTQPGNEQRSVFLTWSGQLGQRTTGSLGMRHTSFDSDTNPYNETALVGSVALRF